MNRPYLRYHIETKKTPNIVSHPYRFRVKVNKLGLAKLLLKEAFHYRSRWKVLLSRPCVYGVFSGPLGGFAPREHLCVGCLRCTVQYPDIVEIRRNPARNSLGDAFFTPDQIDSVVYEAETGHIPVKGAGYRGPFGGEGWDSMWTDMSEIVRPTRDGIHGREFISTEVNIGTKPPFLQFDTHGELQGAVPNTLSIPLPLIFDTLPLSHPVLSHTLSSAARHLQTLAIVPIDQIVQHSLKGEQIIPLVSASNSPLPSLDFAPKIVEMASWSEPLFHAIRSHFPHSQILLRADYGSNTLMTAFEVGVRLFHLVADYHGKDKKGRFVLDLIHEAHSTFVQKGYRDEVTLIGSGGIIAAEHLAKAIIQGLDVIALDTPVLVALQARFLGDNRFELPRNMSIEWGIQRLKNLAGSWRDQLLEVLGAMGLRETRRLRGEQGRAMFQHELEKDAFGQIEGYASR